MEIEHIESVDQVKDALRKNNVCMGLVHPEKYHEWKNILPNSISKSGLVDYMRDPYEYRWAQIEKERKRKAGEKEEVSAALRTGKLYDCLLLTPHLLEEQYVVEEVNRRTKAGKERADQLAAEGKEIITPEEMEQARRAVQQAANALKKIQGSGKLYTQVAVWARIKQLGDCKLAVPLTVSGMFDALIVSNTGVMQIVDLKTTSVALRDERDTQRNAYAYRYGIQAAMYSDLLTIATGVPPTTFSLLYVTTTEPTRTRHVGFSMEELRNSRNEYLSALVDYAEALSSDNWGSAELPYMTFTRPTWA